MAARRLVQFRWHLRPLKISIENTVRVTTTRMKIWKADFSRFLFSSTWFQLFTLQSVKSCLDYWKTKLGNSKETSVLQFYSRRCLHFYTFHFNRARRTFLLCIKLVLFLLYGKRLHKESSKTNWSMLSIANQKDEKSAFETQCKIEWI